MVHSAIPWWNRRKLVAGLAIAGLGACSDNTSAQAADYDIAVHRNRGCTCCEAWTAALSRTGRFRASLADEADMPALKRRLGVPEDLASCHTAQVAGFVIEGHVPPADILRLLAEGPLSVIGLAVPGMPVGSPGMEQPGVAREPFDVLAFHRNGARSVFSRYR